MTKLYENVKMLCIEHKMSIRKLEVILGFPENTISSWKRSLPSCRKVIDVARFFHVTLDFLLGESDERVYNKAGYSDQTHRLATHAEACHLTDDVADGLITLMDIMMNLKKPD